MTNRYDWSKPTTTTTIRLPYAPVPDDGNAGSAAARGVPVALPYAPVQDMGDDEPSGTRVAWSPETVGRLMPGWRGMGGDDAQTPVWDDIKARELAEELRKPADQQNRETISRLRMERNIAYGRASKTWFSDLPTWAQVSIVGVGGLILLRVASALKG